MKKFFLSLTFLTASLLFIPSSGSAVSSTSSDCDAVWIETFTYWANISGDIPFSIRQADFAFHVCNNAGEPQIPQPPQ